MSKKLQVTEVSTPLPLGTYQVIGDTENVIAGHLTNLPTLRELYIVSASDKFKELTPFQYDTVNHSFVTRLAKHIKTHPQILRLLVLDNTPPDHPQLREIIQNSNKYGLVVLSIWDKPDMVNIAPNYVVLFPGLDLESNSHLHKSYAERLTNATTFTKLYKSVTETGRALMISYETFGMLGTETPELHPVIMDPELLEAYAPRIETELKKLANRVDKLISDASQIKECTEELLDRLDSGEVEAELQPKVVDLS